MPPMMTWRMRRQRVDDFLCGQMCGRGVVDRARLLLGNLPARCACGGGSATHDDDDGVHDVGGLDACALGAHDLLNVLVGQIALVPVHADVENVAHALLETDLIKLLFSAGTGHGSPGSVGGAHEAVGVAETAHKIGGSAAGTRDDPADGEVGWGGALAMAPEVTHLPGVVVMVLDAVDHLKAGGSREALMDKVMVGGGVVAHQLHTLHVFTVGIRRAVRREIAVALRDRRCTGGIGEAHVVGGELVARSTAAAVGHEPDGVIGAIITYTHNSNEIGEVVAGAGGAQLARSERFEPADDGTRVPAGVIHDGMGKTIALPFRAQAKGGAVPEDVRITLAITQEIRARQVVGGEAHAAGDVVADEGGGDGVLEVDHPADGEGVALVGVRHEGAPDEGGQSGGRVDLVDDACFKRPAKDSDVTGGG
jgi:hypothetical protein